MENNNWVKLNKVFTSEWLLGMIFMLGARLCLEYERPLHSLFLNMFALVFFVADFIKKFKKRKEKKNEK
jgi:uncharacterized membrane protein YesL